MVCYFLLHGEMNQLYVHTYPLPLGAPLPAHTPIPTPLGHHRAELSSRADSRCPPGVCLIHGSVCMLILVSQFTPLDFLNNKY